MPEDSDLKKALDSIRAKAPVYKSRWEYYDGKHPIAFQNSRMREAIPAGVVFVRNYCVVVVNTARDRLEVDAWTYAPDESIAKDTNKLWEEAFVREEIGVCESALVTGEAYLLVEQDDEGNVLACVNRPGQVQAIYREDKPHEMKYAAKVWYEEGKWKLNLYYPDKVTHYETMPRVAESLPTDKDFHEIDEQSLAHGIPVFHFRVTRREPVGELTKGLLSAQDALNKLHNDMMVASEYCSFPLRWGIGNFEKGKIPAGPGDILKIPPAMAGDQPVSVGAFATVNPDNYIQPMADIRRDMSVMTATPKHFFDGQGDAPSGEALAAMEAPLIAKIENYQQAFGPVWRDAMVHALLLKGVTAQTSELKVIWKPAQTQQPQSVAVTRKTNTEAGIPIVNQLRDEGWTEEELDQLRKDAGENAEVKAIEAGAPTAPPSVTELEGNFAAIGRPPDIAGQLAESGALSRLNAPRTGKA